jgi:hypothetical protein
MLPEAPADWLHPLPDGALLRVHVGPGAARPGVAGVRGDALRVRVAAPPERGAANDELLVLLAGALGVRPSALSIETGAGSRRKRVRVRGMAAGAVRARLTTLLR